MEQLTDIIGQCDHSAGGASAVWNVVYGLCPLFLSGPGGHDSVPGDSLFAQDSAYAGNLGTAESAEWCSGFADPLGEYYRAKQNSGCLFELSQRFASARGDLPESGRELDGL